jgi:hypothetical protein
MLLVSIIGRAYAWLRVALDRGNLVACARWPLTRRASTSGMRSHVMSERSDGALDPGGRQRVGPLALERSIARLDDAWRALVAHAMVSALRATPARSHRSLLLPRPRCRRRPVAL